MGEDNRKNLSNLLESFYLNLVAVKKQKSELGNTFFSTKFSWDDSKDDLSKSMEEITKTEEMKKTEIPSLEPIKKEKEAKVDSTNIMENWKQSRKEILQNKRLRLKRELMDVMDTFLLYFPAIPYFIWTMKQNKQRLDKSAIWLVIIGMVTHWIKQKMKKWRWFGVFVCPLYILYVGKGQRRSIQLSLFWFVTSVTFVRAGSSLVVRRKFRNQ